MSWRLCDMKPRFRGPIPFPWRRVVPGLVICAVALTALLVVAVIQFSGGAVARPVPRVFVNIVENANRVGLDWARARCLICPDAARVRKNLTQSKIIWLGIPPQASVAVIGFLA